MLIGLLAGLWQRNGDLDRVAANKLSGSHDSHKQQTGWAQRSPGVSQLSNQQLDPRQRWQRHRLEPRKGR